MRQDFIDQTGLTGDVMEYANPERSRVDTMMYTGADPWHRIGTKLDNPATAEEAITAAGLDWQVRLERTFTRNLKGDLVELDNRAIVREDTESVFAVVGNRYSPLQNADAFSFFDAVVGAGEAIYHTAGSLKGGRLIWILAKLPDDIGIGGDTAEKYIMLSNSHDGSRAVDMRFCVRRVICWNTFKMAVHNDELNVRLRHTGDILSKVTATRDALGLADAYFVNFMRGMEKLATTYWDDHTVAKYIDQLCGTSRHADGSLLVYRKHAGGWVPAGKRRTDMVGSIQRLYQGDGMGSSLDTSRGTAWGAFNAVTEYLEHHRPMRNISGDDSLITARRLDSSFYGVGAKIEQRAWNLAHEMSFLGV